MTIRDKLKALTAPSREVDAEIAVMFGVPNAHFTASLDAAVELVEREMKETNFVVTFEHDPGQAVVAFNLPETTVHKHKLLTVALLLAMLDAKEVSSAET